MYSESLHCPYIFPLTGTACTAGSSSSASTSASKITRKVLGYKVRDLGSNHVNLLDKMLDYYFEIGGSAEYASARMKMKVFLAIFRRKLASNYRNYDLLFTKENVWLSKLFTEENHRYSLATGPGRKQKNFAECTPRTKRRKISEITSKHPTEALALATKFRAKSSPGQKDLGFIVDKAQKNPTKIKKNYQQHKTCNQNVS